MPTELQILLSDGKPPALRHANLFADQIKTRDHLRHGMLNLNAGVHFNKVKLAIFPKELDGPCPAIAHSGHGARHDAAHPLPLFSGNHGRRGFFQNLLVAALERAIPFPQMDGIAFTIPEDLKLNMARIAEIFLEIDRRIAERGFRLGARLLHLGLQLFLAVHHFHAATAAA